jgi:threonine dehydratase
VRLGARVELAGTTTDDRMRRAEEIVAETGGVLVPPYDDPRIVAGQGTAGLEIVEDLPTALALVLVPVGGGGLSAGVAAAVKLLSPARAWWASSRWARPSCRAPGPPARRCT